ncbi:MAG: DoxX family protein [Ignavibacteriaceae bacterium]
MKINNKVIILLIGTNSKNLSIGLLLLRCTIGVILFIIGSGKVLGWFGGLGLQTTIQYFTTKMDIPVFLVYLSCYTEFIGGFLLIIGLFTRPVAIAVTINMIVATSVMLPNGFMGASGASYPFFVLISAVIIILAGPMSFSIDNILFAHGKIINDPPKQ